MSINREDYKTNFHSHGGEDGVIQKILEEAQIADGFFVEFGAWDGVFLSNTCHLARIGWGGMFIEADEQRQTPRCSRSILIPMTSPFAKA